MLAHLRFADDIVLITDNLGEIRTMIIELDAVCKVGSNINFRKTQSILVHKYKYLGH